MDKQYLESKLIYLKDMIAFNERYLHGNPDMPEEVKREIKAKCKRLQLTKNQVEEELSGPIESKTEYNTVYCQEENMTFIFLDEVTYRGDKWDSFISRELVGWYYGEPNDEDTKAFSNHYYRAEY